MLTFINCNINISEIKFMMCLTKTDDFVTVNCIQMISRVAFNFIHHTCFVSNNIAYFCHWVDDYNFIFFQEFFDILCFEHMVMKFEIYLFLERSFSTQFTRVGANTSPYFVALPPFWEDSEHPRGCCYSLSP